MAIIGENLDLAKSLDINYLSNMMNGYQAYTNRNAYENDKNRLKFKALDREYNPIYTINGLDIYSIPGSNIMQYLDPVPEGQEYSEGLWGTKGINPDANYYFVRNTVGGSYSPVPKGGSISNLIDFYLKSPISPKNYDESAQQARQQYLDDVEVRARDSRNRFIQYMTDQGYMPWQYNVPDLDYYRYINDGLGDIEQLRERYPNNPLLGSTTYFPPQDQLWDADAVERAKNQQNILNSFLLVNQGYRDMVNGYSPYTNQQEINNIYNDAKVLSDVVNTGQAVTGLISSPIRFGLGLGAMYLGNKVGDKITDGVVRITTPYNSWNELAHAKWGWDEENGSASNPGGLLLGGAGLLFGPKLANVPKEYYLSYLRHPTWVTYQHGTPEIFNINEARTGSFNNIGLHASRANNNAVAQDFGSNGRVITFRAPRWKSETVDIDDNNFLLLDPEYKIAANERLLDFGPGSKLKHKLLREAGSDVYYKFDTENNFSGVFNQNDVTINLQKQFKGLTVDFKVEADNIVSRGKQLNQQWLNQTIDFESYTNQIQDLNRQAADLLKRSGNSVIRYNNDIEGVGKPGSPQWNKPNYSYIITDPSTVDYLPSFNWRYGNNFQKGLITTPFIPTINFYNNNSNNR